MPTIVQDGLPRQIAYPLDESFFRRFGDVFALEKLGLYFLYISGRQVDHFDPLMSKDRTYPVLAIDVVPPPLDRAVILQLLQEQRLREKNERRQPVYGSKNGGPQPVATAQEKRLISADEKEKLELPSVSVLVLPVRKRVRDAVFDAVARDGQRPLRNWLATPEATQDRRRPLVLVYDEQEDRLRSKFAEAWSDPKRPRIYY